MKYVIVVLVVLMTLVVGTISRADYPGADFYYVTRALGHLECVKITDDLFKCPDNHLNDQSTPNEAIDRDMIEWSLRLKNCREVNSAVAYCEK